VLKTKIFFSLGLMTTISISAPSYGQKLTNPDEVLALEAITGRTVQFTGWDSYLGLGLTGTLNENQNVVGKDDGQSTTLGLKTEAAIDFKQGQHEWLNSLNLMVAYSRTPQIPNYLKSEDTLELESLYKFYLETLPWLGFFARLSVDTATFPGYDTHVEEKTFRKLYRNGDEEIVTGERLKLTDSFRPMRFRESLGGISQLIDQKYFRWDIKAGIGFRQIIARGQFVVDNVKATPEIEVRELDNYRKAGYELGTEISGSATDKRLTYKLRGDILLPFHESPNGENDRSQFDKRIIDINGRLSFHMLDWASLDYLLKVVRDPDINDRAQVSQTYLFSINKTIASRRTH